VEPPSSARKSAQKKMRGDEQPKNFSRSWVILGDWEGIKSGVAQSLQFIQAWASKEKTTPPKRREEQNGAVGTTSTIAGLSEIGVAGQL